MSVSLDDIKYFLMASETLNITRASERLGITQPTLSYAIKRLEEDLEGELFIRLKNGVQLTKLGESFLSQAHQILLEWNKVSFLRDEDNFAGTYALGVHPSVALYTLEHFMPNLKKSYPKISFKLIHDLSRKITENVINWKLDFGIVVNPKKHPDLVIKEICQDRVSLFGTSQKHSVLIHDDNLKQVDYVLKKVKKHYQFNSELISGNLEVAAKLAAIGYGAAILPARVAGHYKKLKCLTPDIFFKDRICLVYRHEKHKDLIGKKIIQIILKGNY